MKKNKLFIFILLIICFGITNKVEAATYTCQKSLNKLYTCTTNAKTQKRGIKCNSYSRYTDPAAACESWGYKLKSKNCSRKHVFNSDGSLYINPNTGKSKYEYSGQIICVRYTCEKGKKSNNQCILTDQTSCEDGWTQVETSTTDDCGIDGVDPVDGVCTISSETVIDGWTCSENIDNPATGSVLISIVWIIGIATIIFAVCYYKKSKKI